MYKIILLSISAIFFFIAFLYSIKWNTAVVKNMYKVAHKLATYTVLSLLVSYIAFILTTTE